MSTALATKGVIGDSTALPTKGVISVYGVGVVYVIEDVVIFTPELGVIPQLIFRRGEVFKIFRRVEVKKIFRREDV